MATVREFLRSRVRHLLSAALVLLGIITIIPGFSGSAAAHHAEATATIDCTGVISYTATAWVGYPDNPATPENEYELSRTNDSVIAWVEIIGGSGVPPNAQFGSFNSANSYTFSGTFQWPAGATIVNLKVEALVPWGNGNAAGSGPWPVYLVLPTNCGTTTTTTTTMPETTTTTMPETTTTTMPETTTTMPATTTTTIPDCQWDCGTTTTTSTTTTMPETTTTMPSTTTTMPATTTTTIPDCQWTCGTTTTTTTTTMPTTTMPTTTTTVVCGGGDGTTTTSPSCGGTTTTVKTTTTVSGTQPRTGGTLPRSGGGGQSRPTVSMAFGFGCIGSALLLSRPRLPRRWRVATS